MNLNYSLQIVQLESMKRGGIKIVVPYSFQSYGQPGREESDFMVSTSDQLSFSYLQIGIARHLQPPSAEF
jgi:hypothetical protein